MQKNKKEYDKLIKKLTKPSPNLKNCLWAFFVGGFICTLGQAFGDIYKALGADETEVKTFVPITLIFIAALLTGLNIFDKIAKRAGAGTLVPITGFANAVVSPAIEFKAEGYVLGVGANMFKIAGPVITYGVIASVVYGIIYWVTTLF